MVRLSALAWVLVACGFRTQTPAGERDDAAAPPPDIAEMPDGSVDASDDTAPDAPPQNLHLRIEAHIDGESHLYIKGTTVHWKHFIYAAPGRWDADGAAPFSIRPIKLDGVDWFPTWPDVPNPENRICTGYPCAGVESSSTQIPIGVPRVPSTTTWTEVQTRRAQGIVQYPSAANDWELVVLISDYMVGGSADYIVDIDVTIQ